MSTNQTWQLSFSGKTGSQSATFTCPTNGACAPASLPTTSGCPAVSLHAQLSGEAVRLSGAGSCSLGSTTVSFALNGEGQANAPYPNATSAQGTMTETAEATVTGVSGVSGGGQPASTTNDFSWTATRTGKSTTATTKPSSAPVHVRVTGGGHTTLVYGVDVTDNGTGTISTDAYSTATLVLANGDTLDLGPDSRSKSCRAISSTSSSDACASSGRISCTAWPSPASRRRTASPRNHGHQCSSRHRGGRHQSGPEEHLPGPRRARCGLGPRPQRHGEPHDRSADHRGERIDPQDVAEGAHQEREPILAIGTHRVGRLMPHTGQRVQRHALRPAITTGDWGGGGGVSVAASPPEGAQFYGTVFPGGPPSYLLGASGATCQAAFGSADGGAFMTATSATNPSQRVTMVLHAGGVGPEIDLACPYIPATLAAEKAFRGNTSLCARPSGDVVQQIPTGSTNLYAAAVRVPASVKDPNLASSGDGTDPTVALYTAQVIPPQSAGQPQTANAQMVSCTLPARQQDVCAASLAYFLATQSDVGTHVPKAGLTKMQEALSTFLSKR